MSYYFRDQLSIKTNKILANLFAELILLSEKVQSFRQILASVPYYDCVQLFRTLDRGQKGFLRLSDFLYLIGQSHKKVVTYAFSWFDQAKLGEISRLQFISFLMPRRDEQLREVTARRIQEPVNDDNLSTIHQQLKIFTQLINQMVSHQLKIIQQRKLLLKQQDYSLKGVLHSLDANVHQFVTSVDILKFLQNYAIKASKQQISDLLEIVDSKLKGQINLDQLKWIVQGLQTKQKEYLKKIKSTMKGKTSRRSNVVEQQSKPNEKQFVRTPLKSKQKNLLKKSLQKSIDYQTSQKSSLQASNLKQSNINKDNVHESDKRSRVKESNQKVLDKDYFTSAAEIKFDSIIQRYKEAEREALKRDDQLIRAQLEIKDKLRDQFEQKSNQRRRVITQTNTMVSQRRDRQQFPMYYPQRSLRNEFTEPKPRIRQISHEYDNALQFQHPYSSIYDRKINTIVQNFYRRNNNDTFSDASRKYGTLSGSFNYERQRSQSTTFNRSQYNKNSSSYNKFLQEEPYKADRIKAFDHEPTLLKNQINKKLGDDIFNINISHKKYDPLMHQVRQKPLEQSIRRLKQTTQNTKSNNAQIKTSSPRMMQNISIISKDIPSIHISAAKPSPKVEKQFKSNNTEQKAKFAQTPSSAYQSVLNGQISQKRGLHTTETRYPGTQIKSYGSPLNYPRRQL